MPLPRSLARFNRVVTNRIMGLWAPYLPPWAVVLHVGRASGRTYRTPVWAFGTDEGYAIALTYGAGSDWVRNVLHFDACGLRRAGRTETMVRPEVVAGPEALRLVPAPVRVALDAIDVEEVLHLRLAA